MTDAQRQGLAEIDRTYQGRIAEREIFLRQQLEQALVSQDGQEADKIRKQIASERARLEEERDEQKERIRRQG